jgi:hypothetical protein
MANHSQYSAKKLQLGISFLLVVTIALVLAPAAAIAQTCNADDIFVGNNSNGTVVRFSKADIAVNGNASVSTVIGTALGSVEGITLDFNGSVIVTTRASNKVYRLGRTGFPSCAIGTISTVEGPSFDAAGNLFVNDTNTPITYKAAPPGGFCSLLSPVPWINTYPPQTFTEDTRISPSTAPLFPSSLYILGSFGSFNNPNSIQAWSETVANHLLGTVIPDFGAAAGLGIGMYQSLGMAFDSDGDIWTSDFSEGAGVGRLLEFNSAGVFQRLVTVPGSSQEMGKIAISAPNPADPLNPNNNTIYVTDYGNNKLYILDEVTGNLLFSLPSNLNGSLGVAVCDVIVKPQPGYLEICKASDPAHPVTGTFTFTATRTGFNSGPISVPVGQCSGSIQVPSSAVTVTETPVLGVAVSNVTAYAYDELGFYHDELNSWTLPDLHAIVNVMAGDEDEETLTTFTNYAAPPGLLKLCKVAGDDFTLGQLFQFTVTSGGQRHVYYITAGPRQQGGNCVLAGNFPVNTQVTITEAFNFPYFPVSITVNEGQLQSCSPVGYCAIATIIPGITEVTYTNDKAQHRCLECEKYQ